MTIFLALMLLIVGGYATYAEIQFNKDRAWWLEQHNDLLAANDRLREMCPFPIPIEQGDGEATKQWISRRHIRRLHEMRTQGYFYGQRDMHEVEKRCVGCGTELSNYTDACGQCVDRASKRGVAGTR